MWWLFLIEAQSNLNVLCVTQATTPILNVKTRSKSVRQRVTRKGQIMKEAMVMKAVLTEKSRKMKLMMMMALPTLAGQRPWQRSWQRKPLPAKAPSS